MKNEDQLLIKKFGNSLSYVGQGLSTEFKGVFEDLKNSAHNLISALKLAHNTNLLSTDAFDALDQVALNIIKDYGYSLYKQVIPASLARDLYNYRALHILEDANSNYYWELLHDGHNFCSSYLPIIRAYAPNADILSVSDAGDAKPDNTGFNLGVINFSPLSKSDADSLPGLDIGFDALCLYLKLQPALTVLNLGFLSTDVFKNGLNFDHRNPSLTFEHINMLLISAFTTKEGVMCYNQQLNAISILPYSDFAKFLAKLSTNRALKGVILRLWDVESGSFNSFFAPYLSHTGLKFVLFVKGLLDFDILEDFLSFFIKSLSIGVNVEKSYFKSLISIQNRYQTSLCGAFLELFVMGSRLGQPVFNFNPVKDFKSQPVALFSPLKKNSLKLGDIFKHNLQYNFFSQIVIHFIYHSSEQKLLLASHTSQPLLESVQYALSRQINNQIFFSELAVVFEYSAMRIADSLLDATGDIEFLTHLWNSFLINQIKGPKDQAWFLILQNYDQDSATFQYWIKKKLLSKARLIVASSNEKLVYPAGFKICDDIPLAHLAARHASFREQIGKLKNLSGVFLKNRLWFKFWVYDDKLWHYLAGLSANDFYQQLAKQIKKTLSPQQFSILVFLYLTNTTLPKYFFDKLLNTDVQSDIAALIKMELGWQNLSANNLQLNPAYYHFIKDYLIKDDELINFSGVFLEAFGRIAVHEVLNGKQIFLLALNFSELNAFKGVYNLSFNMLLVAYEKIILRDDYLIEYLLIWLLSAISWIDNFDYDILPNWAEDLWRLLFLPAQTILPTKVARSIIKLALEKFTLAEQWGAYSLATASLACLYYQASDSQSFINLAKDAVNTSKQGSSFCYFDTHMIILKFLISQSDKKLFDLFASNFQYNPELIVSDHLRRKDITVLDLGFFMLEDDYKSGMDFFIKLQSYNTKTVCSLEYDLLKKFLVVKKLDENMHFYQAYLRLMEMALAIKDQNLLKSIYQYFFYYHLNAENWGRALNFANLIVILAKDLDDMQLVSVWADKVAFLHFKLGQKEANAQYYAISKQPELIYQSYF